MEHPDTQVTDGELLRRLRLRDKQAWGQLAESHGASLMRAAYLYLGDRSTAEDVVQETLIAAWDSIGRAPVDLRLRPWLLGILMNECRMYRRSLWRRLRWERAATEQREANNGGGEETNDLEALRLAMQRLDADHRSVVILRYEQGLDVAETAVVLGLPAGTVKSRTHTAIEKLKSMLGKRSCTR